jgi:hypothetical protein
MEDLGFLFLTFFQRSPDITPQTVSRSKEGTQGREDDGAFVVFLLMILP